jgi:fructose-bisphosphate aldolase class I
MNPQALIDIARSLVVPGKGLLAIDESDTTCDKRFAKLGIPQTSAARREYRELLITAPGLGASISGMILYDETIRQHQGDGAPFLEVLKRAGIIAGIKVDVGAKRLAACPGETITEGLDGLRDRLETYFQLGARFAKWRAVIAVAEGLPSRGCIAANAHALARYAALCQEAGLVPVVEPEVLMDGSHTLQRCRDVTEACLTAVFEQLRSQRVLLEGMILKPNMVLPGLACPQQESAEDIAAATVQSLLECVPAAVPAGATALGADVFLRARYPGTSPWNLGRRELAPRSGTTRAAASRALQWGRESRKIRGGNGIGLIHGSSARGMHSRDYLDLPADQF